MSQDKSLSYTSYLALEEILGAQRPTSEEHDEVLFVIGGHGPCEFPAIPWCRRRLR